MQAKKRYLLVLASVAFLALCYFGGHRLKSDAKTKWKEKLERSLNSHHHHKNQQQTYHNSVPIPPADYLLDNSKCRMETCFNFSKCVGRPFKVFVYPEDEYSIVSDSYAKILNHLRESNYYTSNPEEACIFVLSLDTLDRDHLSGSFARNLPNRLSKMASLWNGGTNHIVFNLYSGTFNDDYHEANLEFDVGRAILAKASMSDGFYRPGFDVSLPLFHKNHLAKGSDAFNNFTNVFPVNKRYFLAFKGKRYVYGIGSDTRNSLYHLHNGKDVVLVTTCKHNNDWELRKDERCDRDILEYDR